MLLQLLWVLLLPLLVVGVSGVLVPVRWGGLWRFAWASAVSLARVARTSCMVRRKRALCSDGVGVGECDWGVVEESLRCGWSVVGWRRCIVFLWALQMALSALYIALKVLSECAIYIWTIYGLLRKHPNGKRRTNPHVLWGFAIYSYLQSLDNFPGYVRLEWVLAWLRLEKGKGVRKWGRGGRGQGTGDREEDLFSCTQT